MLSLGKLERTCTLPISVSLGPELLRVAGLAVNLPISVRNRRTVEALAASIALEARLVPLATRTDNLFGVVDGFATCWALGIAGWHDEGAAGLRLGRRLYRGFEGAAGGHRSCIAGVYGCATLRAKFALLGASAALGTKWSPLRLNGLSRRIGFVYSGHGEHSRTTSIPVALRAEVLRVAGLAVNFALVLGEGGAIEPRVAGCAREAADMPRLAYSGSVKQEARESSQPAPIFSSAR